MTRSPLTLILLNTVSRGAVAYRLYPRLYGFELSRDYQETVTDFAFAANPVQGFLARIRRWFRLIFTGAKAAEPDMYSLEALNDIGSNRRSDRADKHELPLAYRTYALGQILLRRYGYIRFVQWLSRFTLRSRIERCFLFRRRFWNARRCFAVCLELWARQSYCSAPLFPD